MSSDLYSRYMAAAASWRAHRAGCTTCHRGTPCAAGGPLFERFARLQDAHLNRRST